MARPVATLCLLALLAGASASDNSRLDLLRRLASEWPGRWDATHHHDLNPDSRYTNPESRYTTRYNAAPSHNSRYASGPMTSNRLVGTLSDGDRFMETPDNRFVGTPDDDRYIGTPDSQFGGTPLEKRLDEDETADEYEKNLSLETFRDPSEKRSAVATALNAGRRRRQPAPALGKAVTPYVGVGVLNDVGSFFDSLRDNLETLASLSPQERASLFHDPPTVVHAPAQLGGSGGGVGFRKLHALRPLRPTGNIRSYNRRSLVEAEDVYPGANHHDPGLLWTGLGR